MNETRHSVAEIPGATNIMFAPDIEARLLGERDKHAEIARMELRNDPPDFSVVNENDALARLYFEAAETIRRLKSQNEEMRRFLSKA